MGGRDKYKGRKWKAEQDTWEQDKKIKRILGIIQSRPIEKLIKPNTGHYSTLYHSAVGNSHLFLDERLMAGWAVNNNSVFFCQSETLVPFTNSLKSIFCDRTATASGLTSWKYRCEYNWEVSGMDCNLMCWTTSDGNLGVIVTAFNPDITENVSPIYVQRNSDLTPLAGRSSSNCVTSHEFGPNGDTETIKVRTWNH